MKGATRPRSPAQSYLPHSTSHLPFATSPCSVVPGDGSRVLVFDVTWTCRRISITDHRLNKEC